MSAISSCESCLLMTMTEWNWNENSLNTGRHCFEKTNTLTSNYRTGSIFNLRKTTLLRKWQKNRTLSLANFKQYKNCHSEDNDYKCNSYSLFLSMKFASTSIFSSIDKDIRENEWNIFNQNSEGVECEKIGIFFRKYKQTDGRPGHNGTENSWKRKEEKKNNSFSFINFHS